MDERVVTCRWCELQVSVWRIGVRGGIINGLNVLRKHAFSKHMDVAEVRNIFSEDLSLQLLEEKHVDNELIPVQLEGNFPWTAR